MKQTMVKSLTAVDLFCGCGGMSWGLKKLGIDVKLGVELNKKYLSSYATNFGPDKAKLADLNELDGDQILVEIGLKRGELDFLVGGPPCQGFSKNIPRKHRQLDSDNNKLVLTFLERCEQLFPRHVVMENVAEMKNGFESTYSDEVVNSLENLGYNVIYKVFNSADFGVPQRRKRAFFLGSRDSVPAFPMPTHFKGEGTDWGMFPEKAWVKVWEAIGDLPSLKHDDPQGSVCYETAPQNDYQRQMRGNAVTVMNHVPRKLSADQLKRLSALKPGEGHSDLPPELQVKGGYSGAYGRLTEDMVAPTITRWVFHPGSGRWGHPRDIRTLTLREIARIQSFSDDFVFTGSYNEVCGQLGNAVPPLLMAAVLRSFSDVESR